MYVYVCESDLSEEVSHLELVLLIGQIALDLRIRVVDDGQEHVEQDEEHEEHVQNEVGRTICAREGNRRPCVVYNEVGRPPTTTTENVRQAM